MNTAQLLTFVRQFALTDEEARPLIERAQQPDYWLSICPRMTIGSSRPVTAPRPQPCPELQAAVDDYGLYGHCVVNEAFSLSDIEALTTAIRAVHDAGWPMIFAFIYDQFWTITRTPKLDTFVRTLVGHDYQPTISFWVNHVPATRGGSGFTPHLDDVRPGHHSVTCWLPLTPATADNGCVYVVEKSPSSQAEAFVGLASFTPAQVCNVLARVRALPVNPGSFLAWPNDTLHWGGMFLRGDQARLALSWHFAAADYENVDPVLRVASVPERALPSFESRLKWACLSMLRFRGRDPMLERFAPVARHLIKAARAAC
jgi:hypothetical protein